MQTLPTIAQTNILSFLAEEHNMFHSKDLEFLALFILSEYPQLDFWVQHAAQILLSTVRGSGHKCIKVEKESVLVPLPSWLLQYKEQQPPVLPWLPSPATLHPNTSIKKRKARSPDSASDDRQRNSCDDAQGHPRAVEHPVNDVGWSINDAKCHVKGCIVVKEGIEDAQLDDDHHRDGKAIQNEDDMIALPTPPCVDEGRKEPSPSSGHGADLHMLAQSLRKLWLERQPTQGDLDDLQALADPTTVLNLLLPWTMDDDFVLSALTILMTKDSGYLWSSQIMSFFLLPKLLHLEAPASRSLVSAVMQAACLHTRAAVDALLLPSVLIKKGLNEVQCDVMNRVVKECMADHQLLSFCEKVFMPSKRHVLPFTPPFQDLCTVELVWSEAVCSMIQSMLSKMASADEELLGAIVKACSDEVGRLSRSLKFSNLLLCIISRFGPCLKPYRSILQRVSQRTQTFMSKSLITKTSAL